MAGDITDDSRDKADQYLARFHRRVMQDALNEASGAYWERRAATFEAVGTPACDEIAQACRNRATLGWDG